MILFCMSLVKLRKISNIIAIIIVFIYVYMYDYNQVHIP